MTQYHEVALYHLRQKDKPRALLALRRKKYHESLLSKTDSQLAQLEALTSDVEFALVQKDVVFGLQRGTEVLKDIRKEMGGVENVEKLMSRNEEERQFANEVAEMLSGRMTREEEDEVEDELERLVARQTKVKDQVEMPNVPEQGIVEDSLPSAPDAVPIRPRQRQEEDGQAEERTLLPA